MPARAVIAGVGHTSFGSHPGREPLSLIVEATRNAVADAGIEKDLIDGVLVKFPTSKPEFMFGQKVADALGLQPRVGGVWDQGGAANISLIAYAAMAIEAKQCDIAVICFADNPKTGTRAAYQRPRGDGAPFGFMGALAGYAMVAQRHIQQHGTPVEALGAVAVACRKHGAENPKAQLQKSLTLDDYLSSPPLVSPFNRNDCALISDGGAAVIVMSEKRAKELNVPAPVPILGFGQGQESWEISQRPDLTTTMAKASATTAFNMAGVKPKDIDVAQLYDCFTITVLMTLEDYGFCPKGSVYDFIRDGAIEFGGQLPINTSGGLLSETGMPGLQLVIEGVRQMRGTAKLQVPHAQTCLVSNQGGIMHTHSTLILGQ